MRKLGLVLCGFVVLFLVGCSPSPRQVKREAARAAHSARPAIAPRIDGPSDPLIRKFETEFSDGTKVGCVSVWNESVSCVTLTGSDL